MNSFTQRIMLRFAILVTATTALVLAMGGWMLERQMIHGTELMHDVEVGELRGLVGNGKMSNPEVEKRVRDHADDDAALYFIQMHDNRGRVLFRSPNLGSNVLPDLTGREDNQTLDVPGIGPVHLSEYRDAVLHIQVASPLAPMRRQLRYYVQIATTLTLGVALLSLALGYAFGRITLRPVRAIATTANRIRSDNLSERIPVPSGSDELVTLTKLLNQMFDRLQSSFEQMRRFSADASHELKTPLALIRLNAEKIRPRLAHDEEGAVALDDLLEETTRLRQIIDRLLFLAKSESGALLLNMRPMTLAALLDPLAEDASALAEDKEAHFKLAHNVPGTIQGDLELLRQLLLNLISNAVSVSPRDGLITLESYPPVDGQWRFVVTDEGPGLSPEQIARLFERFVRFDFMGHSGQKRGGHGLGLAICKSIAEVHGGTIRAERRLNRTGLSVTVDLKA